MSAVGSYRVTDRDVADFTRDAIVTAFEAVAQALIEAPEEASARVVGAQLLAAKYEVIGRLVEAFDQKLAELNEEDA